MVRHIPAGVAAASGRRRWRRGPEFTSAVDGIPCACERGLSSTGRAKRGDTSVSPCLRDSVFIRVSSVASVFFRGSRPPVLLFLSKIGVYGAAFDPRRLTVVGEKPA